MGRELDRSIFSHCDGDYLCGCVARCCNTDVYDVFQSARRINRWQPLDYLTDTEYQNYLCSGKVPLYVRIHTEKILVGLEPFVGDKHAFIIA